MLGACSTTANHAHLAPLAADVLEVRRAGYSCEQAVSQAIIRVRRWARRTRQALLADLLFQVAEALLELLKVHLTVAVLVDVIENLLDLRLVVQGHLPNKKHFHDFTIS